MEVTVAGIYTNFKCDAPEKAVAEIDDTELEMLMLAAVEQPGLCCVTQAKDDGAFVGWRVEPGANTILGVEVGMGDSTPVHPVTAAW
jgi:hypothetical protein